MFHLLVGRRPPIMGYDRDRNRYGWILGLVLFGNIGNCIPIEAYYSAKGNHKRNRQNQRNIPYKRALLLATLLHEKHQEAMLSLRSNQFSLSPDRKLRCACLNCP